MKLTNTRSLKLFTLGLSISFASVELLAELLQQDFNSITHNKSSQLGMPLSSTPNNPTGSDGRAPFSGTKGQFGGFLQFGSSVSPKIAKRDKLTSDSYFNNASNIGLPKGSNGYVLTRASVGAPIYGRTVNFLLGDIIDKPSSMGSGDNKILIGNPNTYWADEPFISGVQVKSAQELGGEATILTLAAHGFVRGDLVLITGVQGVDEKPTTVLQIIDEKRFLVKSNYDPTEHMLDSLEAASDDNKTIEPTTMVVVNGLTKKTHVSLGYYFSPHAKSVMSIQPGPLSITWRESRSQDTKPSGAEGVDWVNIEGLYYKLYKEEYIVSASSAKDPVTIYWNKDPVYDGPLVTLPEGLGDLSVIYTKFFPERVAPDNAKGMRETGTGQSVELELRTLWLERLSAKVSVLRALNLTGRVIIELLGDAKQDGTRDYLGYEIVDVKERSIPSDKTLDLGDRVMAYNSGKRVSDESLIPDMRDQGINSGKPYTIEKQLPGTRLMAHYAIRETVNRNDLVAFWMREGMAGIYWPAYHNRYQLQWPVESDRYSHYIRPNYATKELARENAKDTAVELPQETSPYLQYQDLDPNGAERAVFESGLFYSWLDSSFPTHRTLISYETPAGGIAFEHVLSWLDQSIKSDDWPVTEQTTHLSIWPKVRVSGNHGVSAMAQVGITARLYNNITDDNDNDKIVKLIRSNRLSEAPDEEVTMNDFEWRDNSGDNYATHFLGYFHPPNTGYYTFSIASDDQGELYLSTDANPGNVELISRENSWAGSRKYSKAELSDTRYLVSGRAYYIESFHVEGGGGDNMSVAYVFSANPGVNTKVPDDTQPIAGRLLSPWSTYDDLRGGISVDPIAYSFETGQMVEFKNGSYFTFTKPAIKGDTQIYGSLVGKVVDGQVGSLPSISVPPEVQVSSSKNEQTNSLKFSKTNKQSMFTPVQLGNTDHAIEFWFRSDDTSPEPLGLLSVDDGFQSRWSVFLENNDTIRYHDYSSSSGGSVMLFESNFDEIDLGPFVTNSERYGTGSDWSPNTPAGWSMKRGSNHGVTSGGAAVPEFDGWTFINPVSWNATAGQGRNYFKKGTGVIAVADSDEYDDKSDAKFDASLSTPQINLNGIKPGSLVVSFDTSWRPHGGQTGKVTIQFDGETEITLWELKSSTTGTIWSETVYLNIDNPPEADSAVIKWDYQGHNNWWWAIDNIEVVGAAQDTSSITSTNDTTYNDGQWHHIALTINSGDITSPGDYISPSSQEGSNVDHAIDNRSDTVYSNLNTRDTGFLVRTKHGIVSQIALTSSPSDPGKDPSTYKLYGSSNEGKTFIMISEGVIPVFTARSQRQVIKINNSQSYTSYRLLFGETRDKGPMQIAEVELLEDNDNKGLKIFVDGKEKIHNENITHISKDISNLASSSAWTVGTGPAEAATGSRKFNLNGDGNVRQLGQGPFGNSTIIWATKNNDTTSNADGGWEKEITNLSDTQACLSVVYFKRVGNSTNGNFYHGPAGGTFNLNGASVSWPYFQVLALEQLPQDVWCVDIGVIRSKNGKITTADEYSGTYRLDTGEKIFNNTAYKMAPGTKTQSQRTYLYYSTDPQAEIHWANPGFYKINGNQPSLVDILSPSNGINFGSVVYNGLNHYFDGEIDEVRIWKSLRNTADIEKYWDASLDPSEIGLASYYSFEEIVGATIADLSGNDNNGVLKNFGTTSSLVSGKNLPSILKVNPMIAPLTPESTLAFDHATFTLVDSAEKGDTRIKGYLVGSVSAGNKATIDDTTLQNAPRYVKRFADVGKRINPPTNEKGSSTNEDYWAGYIHSGTAYNPNAYINPLDNGSFPRANNGAIIPVNANPNNGKNKLIVYWFRESLVKPDAALGFKPVYWPSVIGEYTLRWPTSGPEIVMASNAGSGALNSLQQKGVIYRQPLESEPGYNPNEEHALMLGGQAWALRNDLNKKGTNDYTSAPYVLLEYTDEDDRISMTAFKVLSEKPDEAIVFDYITEAGKVLQAPMPLPLLDKARHKSEVQINGADYEIGDLMDRQVPFTNATPSIDTPSAWSNTPEHLSHYSEFTVVDRNATTWVFRGQHSGKPSLKVGSYDSTKIGDAKWGNLNSARAVVGANFSYHVHSSLYAEHIQMLPKDPDKIPNWLNIDGLSLFGKPSIDEANKNYDLDLVFSTMDGQQIEKKLKVSVVAAGSVSSQTPLDVTSDGLRFVGRPPYLSTPSEPQNSFRMFYFYKNLDVFDWPSDSTKTAGENIQYLNTPQYLSDKDTFNSHGNRNYVTYRPIWPKSAPTLNRGETLTLPKFGLPAVRGQTSVNVLYQESAANTSLQSQSVKLHDPTREKVYYFPDSVTDFPPADVLTSDYQGKTFFPKLPPNLSERLFYDPNRGGNGGLVLRGEFKDEIVGEKYVQLNLISDIDREFLLGVEGDPKKPAFSTNDNWKNAIEGLSTDLEQFENAKRDDDTKIPGIYVKTDYDKTIEYNQLAEITVNNIPVDSYALSATGPGTGYVTLIVGNGNGKLTPENEPVSVHIIKVTPTLYQGELKPIYAKNPLAEKVSLRHSADFAGEFKDYEFEWRKAYPVDGLSPKLFSGESLNPEWIKIDSASGIGKGSFIHGAGATGVDTLLDVYYIMRYRPKPVTINNGTGYTVGNYTASTSGIKVDATVHSFSNGEKIYFESGGIFTLSETAEKGSTKLRGILASASLRNDEGVEWSSWTKAKFVEGWIKRVLAGINPFNQRLTDLFNNAANTDASMLTQAGRRWEGDIALSLDSMNDFGLIEIYETVLNRGKMLSIDSDINVAGANKALLLAAGYLNDLYMMLGNEAFADASNPTIGFGTGDREYGDISTSMFAFKGQVASLMEEELALLRGRDDFLQPDVEVAPVYNRLFWNYTRGIDAGEVIYALNYNIQERDGEKLDGNVNAADASHMYPQGHGDAYGHYLTAIKGYYRLLVDNHFEWIPQTEAVTVLGQEVSVDYMDERKFATAALALARTGLQLYELTWRQDYKPGEDSGWSHMSKTRTNDRRSYDGIDGSVKNPTRFWGQDHWAARAGSGSYINWVVGNSMIPDVDPDPNHEGIQKIDRSTVLELSEIADLGRELQLVADSAASGVNPLGLPEDTVPFDIDPTFIEVGSGIQGNGHMDQVYEKAVGALNNAVMAFNASKDITQIMRTEEDTLADLQIAVNQEELGYKHRLIELYGTPYTDDIGPGKVYKQGYDGPDLLNYQYVDKDKLTDNKSVASPTRKTRIFRSYNIDRRAFANGKMDAALTSINDSSSDDPFQGADEAGDDEDVSYFDNAYNFAVDSLFAGNDFAETEDQTKITYQISDHGFFVKPDSHLGKRESPGEIQFAIGDIVQTHADLLEALADAEAIKLEMDHKINLLVATVDTKRIALNRNKKIAQSTIETAGAEFAKDFMESFTSYANTMIDDVNSALNEAYSGDGVIIGFSNGGSFMKALKLAWNMPFAATKLTLNVASHAVGIAHGIRNLVHIGNEADWERAIAMAEDKLELKQMLYELEELTMNLGNAEMAVDTADRNYATAIDKYRALVASGNRILKQREIFRKRTAAQVHGFRTRDAAFRIFRNEKLERYKSLFDLAARYSYFAAKAYDYETGQLGSDKGKRFLSRIVASRALGVVDDGTPQFAGSNMGDPGLSSILAEMKADWDVLRGRLGINNPDTYGTTSSLRTENYRILPGSAGTTQWQDILNKSRKRDILVDPHVKQLCMQLANDNGLPVPGIVLEFSTMIADGFNLFGKSLASGDHAFSPTSYATKILGVGVILEGYEGMDYSTNDNGINSQPIILNPNGLSATPYVYLIPCGLDSMRSPPLGDQSVIRTWNVQDATIPMPFNIGASEYETKPMWQSGDSLTEELFNVRKHQAFRAVDSTSFFEDPSVKFPPNPFTNNRLIGRSVWNSKWKLVIPGKTLLDDPEEGLDLFINTVKDIKIHFETYSYSGN